MARIWLYALLLASTPVFAHFQMIIPDQNIINQSGNRDLKINIMFWHPFEGYGMNMDIPTKFGVYLDGKFTDLLASLKPVQRTDAQNQSIKTYMVNYNVNKPGDHIFFVEPKPFWEPTEETFIVHYTKVVVNGYGLEIGWDTEIGAKTEIIPLTRPYGLYTGNVFQGLVKLDGKPVAFSKVEVEYYNETGKLKAPASPYITQIIKTDANGVFTYAMPKSGWWGFAALNTAKETMAHEGKNYPVELGALIWVKTQAMP